MKLKTVFNCEKCGYQSQKWLGRCPECEAWNSFYEDIIEKNKPSKTQGTSLSTTPLSHESEPEIRINTNIAELNRVLGSGLVKGSMVLLSGEPGIGKSTLTLQISHNIAKNNSKVLYISGEESHHQVSMRAQRLGIKNQNLHFLAETNFENILATIENTKPDFIILDSIQVIYSSEIPSMAGSITQVRFCTESIMNFAKKTATPVLLIGHVTKDGNLAGPRVLEHLVDTVLFLEGERYQNYRVLRSLKNRFGPTHEIGIFEMSEEGLTEVTNASKLFLDGRKEGTIGSAITATLEGTRPLLVEVQALTNVTHFGYPKRAGSGFDLNRMQLLIAVIQKYLNLNLSNQDVYINVVSGFKLHEPAADLAVIMAIISSFKKTALHPTTIYIGEVGLSGELRTVTDLEKRIQEAEKMGFSRIVIPKTSKPFKTSNSSSNKAEIIMAESLKDLMKLEIA